ncbi:ATP/GTP-binding protein [Clostridium perfringens]
MTIHIENFDINSFRGITNLTLENLSVINIFVGDNNCGKTSVLESLLLIHKPFSFANIITTGNKRENRMRLFNRSALSNYESFTYLFNKLEPSNKISISAKLKNNYIKWNISGEFNTVLFNENDLDIFINSHNHSNDIIEEEIEEFNGCLNCDFDNYHENEMFFDYKNQLIKFNKYSRIERNPILDKSIVNMNYISSSDYLLDTSFKSIINDSKITNDVIELLHIFDKDIINLKIIQTDERRYIQVVENKILGIIPLSLYGDGFKKVVTLANAIAKSKNGILLVDEIETGIHTSAMNKVFNWLIKACKKFNVQLFLTTHSIETLDQLLMADDSVLENDLIRVITLIKQETNTLARILPGDKALKARNNYNMELR